ncbi:asparagine synthetase B [Candidatus Riflebacteria bacterium]
MWNILPVNKYFLAFCLFLFTLNSNATNYILIPMDHAQLNHLKSYGLIFHFVQKNLSPCWWLLNYRYGSFLCEENSNTLTIAKSWEISYEIIDQGKLQAIKHVISQQNMEIIPLLRAPEIAVYKPPHQEYDDAVDLVLKYARIPYTVLYDKKIIDNALDKFDWLHIHHDDFSGQHGKYWIMMRNSPHYGEYLRKVSWQVKRARELGYKKVSSLKLLVAKAVRDYVEKGGFLFAMCSATDSLDIALAADGVDIVDRKFDGDPPQRNFSSKLNYDNCFAFEKFTTIPNPYEFELSNINTGNFRDIDPGKFTLFEFSAKFDPIPSILTQSHLSTLPGFFGKTNRFKMDFIKKEVVLLAQHSDGKSVNYLCGRRGKGFFCFYGGHNPGKIISFIGQKDSDLSKLKNSAGFRLILNNILFPAAKKGKQKT